MFSKQVKIKLIEKDLSIKQLSEKLGVSASAVSQYLSGNPSLETMRKIADVLDCDLNITLTDRIL